MSTEYFTRLNSSITYLHICDGYYWKCSLPLLKKKKEKKKHIISKHYEYKLCSQQQQERAKGYINIVVSCPNIFNFHIIFFLYFYYCKPSVTFCTLSFFSSVIDFSKIKPPIPYRF